MTENSETLVEGNFFQIAHGSRGVFERLSQMGIGNIAEMHKPEEYRSCARRVD